MFRIAQRAAVLARAAPRLPTRQVARSIASQVSSRRFTTFSSAVVGTITASATLFAYSQLNQAGLEPTVDAAKAKEDAEFKAIRAKYAKIRAAIAEIVHNGNKIEPEKFIFFLPGPLFIRLAWHSSGTFSQFDRSGGSNGATMRFPPECNHAANKGLGPIRDLLEPIKKKYPDISYADLYTLAGAVAVEEMGGPEIKWRPGRVDAVNGAACPPDGRLPSAVSDASSIREVFGRMGFNDREFVALIGAHTVGGCHGHVSGYVGPWTHDPLGFDNSYYQLLLSEKWQVKLPNPNYPTSKTQFNAGDIMMLPAEMTLLTDNEYRKLVELYASNNEIWFKDFAAAFEKLIELGVFR